MSVGGKVIYYTALPVLHAVGALISVVISYACDTGKAVQTARVPYELPMPAGTSRELYFYAGIPWDEGAVFATHTWNPFALIFVFEWLTAAFALRPLIYFYDNRDALLWTSLAWLGAGLAVFWGWSFSNSGGLCVAQFILVTVSFLLTGLICYMTFSGWLDEWIRTLNVKMDSKQPLVVQAYEDSSGRKWMVPSLASLRRAQVQAPIFSLQGMEVDTSYENSLGVLLRYAEYCITAPLLFLAVVCLLVVDAPAWLFLTGYWLLLTCNCVGITLHMAFLQQSRQSVPSSGGCLATLYSFTFGPFFPGPWRDPKANVSCLLQTAWFCLLVPLGGLIFFTRDILFSTDMPVLVVFMLWNLLLSYSLFGIVPTFVYLTGLGANSLAWLLDVLNVSAKFPLPIVILVGFISRPATTKFCYN